MTCDEDATLLRRPAVGQGADDTGILAVDRLEPTRVELELMKCWLRAVEMIEIGDPLLHS